MDTVNFNGSGPGGFVVLIVLWGLFVTIFWMVVGWRAMKAHEKLADATERIAKKGPPAIVRE